MGYRGILVREGSSGSDNGMVIFGCRHPLNEVGCVCGGGGTHWIGNTRSLWLCIRYVVKISTPLGGLLGFTLVDHPLQPMGNLGTV